MTTGSILFSLALLLLVGLFIARPFLLPAPRPPRQSERQILLAQQEALLAQIQAIDFDVETGKVMPEDHTAERNHLLHQAAQIMAELEVTAATPSAQAIEMAVRDLRQKGHGRFCPQCGTAVGVGDKFCASCGAVLVQGGRGAEGQRSRGAGEQGSISLTLSSSLALSLSLLSSLFSLPNQTLPDPIPPTADPASGLAIYNERCAVCHGTTGMGDGEMAAQALLPPTQFGVASYWETADPALMFATIQNGSLESGMPGFGEGQNSNPLSETQIWDVIAALTELPSLNQPIPTAAVQGQATNQTTGEVVTEGTVFLQAFTADFEEGLRLEQPLTADGRFNFALQDVPPQWVYRVIIRTADGLEFGSEFGQLSPHQPTLELALGTYAPTQDAAVLAIAQLDVFVEFSPAAVSVSELYLLDNRSNAVFVGETGDFTEGTVQINVPEGAQNVSFWRGLGTSAADFVPADELMRPLSPTTWAFARPVSAGEAVLQLVVRYDLPYNRQATISHPAPYPIGQANLFVPQGAVAVDGTAGEWQPTTSLVPNFEQYQRPSLLAGQSLAISLSGHPAWVTDSEGNLLPNRDAQQELWLGLGALGLALGAAVYTVYHWRTSPPPLHPRDALLQALATLDAAHEQHPLPKRAYEQQRQTLKEELLAVWED